MPPIVLYLLRMLHIVGGVAWVGTAIFLAAFLLPSLRAAGPSGGEVLRQIMVVRRMPRWLLEAMAVTVLTGVGLYWHDSAGFRSVAWLGSGAGRTFGLGGVLAVVAAANGLTVSTPTATRMHQLGATVAGRPPTDEEAATLAMSIARYVP